MQTTTMENANGRGPIASARCGGFQISIWQWRRIIPPPQYARDYFPEREITVERACIRHGRWDKTKREWKNATIWCELDDLRSLAQALDNLNDRAV